MTTVYYRIKLEELRKLLLSEQKKETYESVDKILDQIKAFSDDELRDLYNGLSDMRNKRNYEKSDKSAVKAAPLAKEIARKFASQFKYDVAGGGVGGLVIGKNPDANHAKYFISVQPENNKIHFSASNGGYINTKPGEPLEFKIDKEQKIANFQQELLPFIQQNYKNDPRVKKITIGHYKDDLYIHLA